MLNRRYLRIKVLQALYAFFQSNESRLDIAERNLINSIEKLYELYIYQLSILTELVEFAKHKIEENKHKLIPTKEDLNPNTRFIENKLIKQISENLKYKRLCNEYKINWINNQDIIKSVFNKLKETKSFSDYLNEKETSYIADKKAVINLVRKIIINDEKLQNYFEEKSIFWSDDYLTVSMLVLKTIDNLREEFNEYYELPGLFKFEDRSNDNDDKLFIIELFRKTIIHKDKYDKIIDDYTANWELERMALIDKIILKMALVEIFELPSIPVKVTLNEYIEISKGFSTEKSNIFINGVLDKIINEFSKKNEIKKIGRGLVNNKL